MIAKDATIFVPLAWLIRHAKNRFKHEAIQSYATTITLQAKNMTKEFLNLSQCMRSSLSKLATSSL